MRGPGAFVRRCRLGSPLAWLLVMTLPATARAGAEIRLDRDFLDALVSQLPEAPFHKDGQYQGVAKSFRLVGIEPVRRRLVASCAVVGSYQPPVAAALKKSTDPKDWKAFAFEVTIAMRAEAGPDGAPRLHVDVEQVKRRELEGVAGGLAKMLGRYFDGLVTQVADGKVDKLSQKINAEIQKRIGPFRQYGVLAAIEYTSDAVVLLFDATRLKREGVVGHVHDTPQAGTVPLHRWLNPRRGDHFYTTTPGESGKPGPAFVYEGIVAYVPAAPGPGVVPLSRWRGPREWFFTGDPQGEGLARFGYRPEAFGFFVLGDPPPEGTVPLYRFLDPRTHLHFYTTHPQAGFAK